jgi:hypothetical protein
VIRARHVLPLLAALLVPSLVRADGSAQPKAQPILPFYWYQPGEVGSLHIPLLLYFSTWDRDGSVKVQVPFFVQTKNHVEDSTTTVIPPLLFVDHRDPNGATTSLFPIYWRFADYKTGATTQFLFPIAGYHHRPGWSGAFVGPVYGWRNTNGLGGGGGGVAPIAMFGRSGTRSHQVVLPPAFVRVADSADGSSTTVVGPVFHRSRGDGRGWAAGVFPILWLGGGPDSSYGYLPPVFFHRKTAAASTDVVGPVFVQRSRSGWSAGVVPLAFFGQHDGRSHQVVLPPLFVRTTAPDAEHLLVGPFYHGRDGARRVDVLFPLLYLRRAPGDGLALSPLGGWRRTPREETTVIGPYVYHHAVPTHSRSHFFIPLVGVHNEPNYHVTVAFPFVWRVREGAETYTTVFPFYFRQRSPTRHVDAVPILLFLHARSPVGSTTLLPLTWVRTRTDGGGAIGVFPLFAWGKIAHGGRSSQYFGMPGAFWLKSDFTASSKLWATLYFQERHVGGYTAGFIPLVFAWRREAETSAIGPLFWHRTNRALDTSITVAGPLYFGHDPEAKQFGLFPLTFNKWRPDGTFTTSVFPLFFARRKPHGTLFTTLVFGWSVYPLGWRAWVGPIYARNDDLTVSGAVFPIAYFSKDRPTGAITRFLFPFYFDRRGAEGRELQAYTPLVWRYHSVERGIIVGLPLFFDVHSYHESRTTGVLPFYVRNNSHVSHSTSWVFPPILTWFRTSHEDHTTDAVVFPIVWRFGGPDSTTVVAPLWWDFKRGSSRTTVFFPLGAHWKREDDSYTLVLNFYYHRGRGLKEGRWYADIFPLAEFGRPRPGDLTWKVLEGLFGYSRSGRNRILHLLWLFEIPLAPAPASNLTWFGSTPASARSELF